MSFFQRVMNHLLNEVLVNGLANARWFQRFAIRSNQFINEAAKKSAEGQSAIKENVTAKTSEFLDVFRKEWKKGVEELQKPQGPKR